MSFEKPTKVWIGSLDADKNVKENGKFTATDLTVEAQYNPGTLEVSQNVPWKKPDAASKTGGTGSAAQKSDRNDVTLEFTGAEGRSISLELLFDGVEQKTSVKGQVEKLEKLAAVQEAGSSTPEKRRPHHCVVVWANVLPRFKCVIESLTTKYTMFALDGTPLRATCTLKLKEAENVQRAKDKKA
jgi:Contractile injection system tube protein